MASSLACFSSSATAAASRHAAAVAAVLVSLVAVACGGSVSDPVDTAPAATATSPTTPTPPPGTPPSTVTTNPPASTPPSTPPGKPPATPPPGDPGCNALVNGAAAITGKSVAMAAPLATGGAVTNGTYHLVDLTLYTGPGGNAGPLPLSIKQTIAINGATAQVITEVSGKSQDASVDVRDVGKLGQPRSDLPHAG